MNNELIIIDDDLPFRNRLSQSMQKKGFNVESFGDAKNSIERMKNLLLPNSMGEKFKILLLTK